MAAPSPALSVNSSEGGHATTTTAPLHRTDTPPKTLRGLNNPKCIQCGNVARSRCPYQSCKSCCSKAQNPCHIHVLKANAVFPDKSPTSSTLLSEQQANEVSLAVSSLRVASLRQLSNNFSQFNNLQASRSRKPLTKKEAATINEWRFSKLKEYQERNIEVENEAFERYMQNISLLKEVFSVKSILESSRKGPPEVGSPDMEKIDMGRKSDATRSEIFQNRIQQIVEVGLNKLQKRKFNHTVNKLQANGMVGKRPEKAKSLWGERASALSDLNDKLTKARNQEDLTSCLELKSQLYDHQSRTEGNDSKDDAAASGNELDFISQKLIRTAEIDQEDVKSIGAHFSSLEKITNL